MKDPMERVLIIFTRYPAPGHTKTRLIPRLGPAGAAALQSEMTLHTLRWARALSARASVAVQVRFEGGDEDRMRACFGSDFSYRPQEAGDLGCRMAEAFEAAFATGAERVILVGTDCPGITAELVEDAFERLAAADLVLGPATDGGYYLIGLRRPLPALFADISWSCETVLRDTLQRARRLRVSATQLATLADVDRPEDLPVWQRVVSTTPANPLVPLISVVIPALNEAGHLGDALLALRDARHIETIVADGGSHDGTSALATGHGAKLVRCSPGRALQMNAGASAAAGEILLFLHADTRLPKNFEQHVREVLDQADVAAGAFRLRIDSSRRAFRLIEWAVNLRSRYGQMPYGDQAIFVRADTFRGSGGFPELPIMEDFEFMRRLRKLGRIALLPVSATTSARRWERLGIWKTTWINQRILAGYCLGIPPEKLAEWYVREPG
jgi:hypothetical protein